VSKVTNLDKVDKLDIKAETSQAKSNTTEQAYPAPSCFKVQSGNTWMKEASALETPKQLVGTLVFQNEMTVLFSPTGTGKSILAVQICDALSRGKAIDGFTTELTQGMKVLYVDCELSTKQFEMRFLDDNGKPYKFAANFHRAELSNVSASSAEILSSLRQEIKKNGIEFLCFDNLTFISGLLQKAAEATVLLKGLRKIQQETGVTLLVIGHTPKKKPGEPMTINDFAGSARLGDFVDAAFAIGKVATDQELRYIKQVKVRSWDNEYDSDHVAVMEKFKGKKLDFRFLRFDQEEDLIRRKLSQEERDARILELAKEGLSCRKIAEEIGCSHGTVNNVINAHKKVSGE
jgi:ATP/maltotriose-dependent transcriptional regulator MalT